MGTRDELKTFAASAKDDLAILERLTAAERRQLGTWKPRANGKPSAFRYATPREWVRLRAALERAGRDSNPKTDPELTAYTPGETLNLLSRTKVAGWLTGMRCFHSPPETKVIVYVPCAKTKPWDGATVGLYRSYNAVRELARVRRLTPVCYLMTISEPLALVPSERWGDFPQYDNPGLFRADALRTSLFSRDWRELGLEKVLAPWDELAYRAVIQVMGQTIAAFLEHHRDLEHIAFVDYAADADASTHGEMLDVATRLAPGIRVRRFPKRPTARAEPLEWILATLEREGVARVLPSRGGGPR